MKSNRAHRSITFLALIILCAALTSCASRPPGGAEILLDGRSIRAGEKISSTAGSARVLFTVDGETLLELPFAEAHTVTIRQPDGLENTVRMTGSAVRMESASCKNHDCVQMGEITMENLEMRAMGGFIVCLPQKVTVEVRVP